MSVDEYFEERPVAQRRIFDAIAKHLRKLGPITIDAVEVGILFKKTRTFAELRPRRDRLVLALLVSRVIEHPRITKTLRTSAHRAACYVDLETPKDVDRTVREWLSEAYVSSPT
jgi:hypothetical protein